MDRIQSRQYEMLRRVNTFGEQHKDLFPADSPAGRAFETVGVAVTELARHAAAKASSVRGGRLVKATTRTELVRRLAEIVRSARVISKSEPGFGDPFHMPEPRSDQALVTTARVFITAGEAAKARFLQYEMPADFVDNLRAVVDRFEAATKTREAGKDGTTQARAGIEAALSSGLDAARTLDVIVANRLSGDPTMLQVWERGRRVDAVRRSRSVEEPNTSDSTAPEEAEPEKEVA